MSEPAKGMVITVRGDVDPGALGAVLMHEHLHSACQDWDEGPTDPAREELLMAYAVPNLRKLHDHGCGAMVDATPIAWRAWPDTYLRVAEAADLHVVLATGFYREMEIGSYWVRHASQAIWPAVREKPVEELAELCVREITEGIHGSSVRAGVIKLGTSAKDLTPAEAKAFAAGAAAQKATGVSITTHCTAAGAHVTQLTTLAAAGVDPARVVIGHTGGHLVHETDSVRAWMKRGATFLPTNLRMDQDWEFWADLVDAVRRLFDEGLGDRIVLGLDWAFETEQGPFVGSSIMPPPPYRYMFTHTLPRFRKLGLEESHIQQMMVANPARILPVQ
ncbi:MAG: phosphotriesterase family protein [Planctomycetota bacterium]